MAILKIKDGDIWKEIEAIKGDAGPKGDTGSPGEKGDTGSPGQDGYSPTVETSKSGKTTTITITDKNGPHTSTILDGEDGASTWGSITGTLSNQTDLNNALGSKQETLVSGTNIKTINNNSLLGSGNIDIQGGSTEIYNADWVFTQNGTVEDFNELFDYLTSGNLIVAGGYVDDDYSEGETFVYAEATPLSETAREIYLSTWGRDYIVELDGENISYSTNPHPIEYDFNKVTSISSSSTNTQYPSAKCVYDNLATKQNTITNSNKLDYSLISNTPDIPANVYNAEWVITESGTAEDFNELYDYIISGNLVVVAGEGNNDEEYPDFDGKTFINVTAAPTSETSREIDLSTLDTNYIVELDGENISYSSYPNPVIPTNTSDLTNDSGYINNTVNNLTNYTLSSSLSSVATSGDYDDLSNKPTIPTKTSDLTNDSNFAVTNANNNFSTSQKVNGNIEATGTLKVGSFTKNTTDTWIPVLNAEGVLNSTKRKIWTSKTHTNHSTDKDELATLSTLTYWNGAYNSSNSSNLTYAYQGTIQCKPTSLYNNTTGTTGNVTLSQDVSNFEYIEIFYGKARDNAANGLSSIKIPRALTQYASMIAYHNDTNKPQLLTKNVQISGTTITHKSGYYLNFTASGVSTGSSNEIKIFRVIGWK